MFVERRINQATGSIELWHCEWENHPGLPAKKAYLTKIGDESPARPDQDNQATEEHAICWSYGRTLGNIAVFSSGILGRFPDKAGDDAELPCDFVHAGKYRMGSDRWWCRTHQTHWGAKADLQAFDEFREMRCANHAQPMHYVTRPLTLNLTEYAEVGIWCSMPAALSTFEVKNRPPKIHVHVRPKANGRKTIDQDFDAMSVLYTPDLQLFGNEDIKLVNITPPAAFEFVRSQEVGREMACINCSACGYPHLDLGDFATKAHKKHFCGNCGRDSTWSPEPIVSTPLKLLHETFARTVNYTTPPRTLNLDDYPDCNYTIWASPTRRAARPQEFGIHVHLYRGEVRIVDDTFGEVIREENLDRKTLIRTMIARSVT